MTKENWIQQILESADTIQQAEPNRMLTQRIQLKIKEQKKPLSFSFYVKWSAAAILLILMNIAVITNSSERHQYHPHHQNHHNEPGSVSTSFDNSISYNY